MPNFSDNFDRPDAVALASPWVMLIAQVGIQSSQAFPRVSSGSNALAAVDLGAGGQNVNVRTNIAASGSEALYWRVVDANNWWRVRHRYYSYDYFTGGSTTITIYRTTCSYRDINSGGGYSNTYESTSSYPSCPAPGVDGGGQGPYEFVSSSTSTRTETYQNTATAYVRELIVEKCVGGTVSQVGGVVNVGAVNHIRVVAQDNTHAIYSSDSPTNPHMVITDGTHAGATRVGIGSGFSEIRPTAGTHDNFTAVLVNSPPTTPGPFTAPAASSKFNTTGLVACGAATDAQNDALTYDFDLSYDGGAEFVAKRVRAAGTSFTYDYSADPSTTGAVWRSRAWDGQAYGGYRYSPGFVIEHNAKPGAPIIVFPANGSTADLSVGFTADWTPVDPDVGDRQTAYALRRKVAGAGAYEWWNASLAAWQSTEVYNLSEVSQVTFAPEKWTNLTVYNWSVSTRDSQGETGPYAADVTVSANKTPLVVVTGPSGTVTTTTRPTISWSYSDPENEPQASYIAKVFTPEVYGAPGFDPETATAVWSSGVVSSAAARNVVVGVELAQGVQYRAYVKAAQTGPYWSTWAWSLFEVNVSPPVSPVLVVSDEPSAGRVRIEVLGQDDGVTYAEDNTRFVVERSDDGGIRWGAVRGASELQPDSDQIAVVYDYEAPPGVAVLYRGVTVGTV